MSLDSTGTSRSALHGQVAIVVGVGGQIGGATARELAARGAAVACLDSSLEAVQVLAEAISITGGTADAQQVDVTDDSSVKEAIAAVRQKRPDITILVNAAGIQGPTGLRTHEIDDESFWKVQEVNLMGAVRVSRHVLPTMLERRYGRIVHLSSMAGKDGNALMSPYSTSKAALIGLVKAMGKEYATSGITINALAPAMLDTPFNASHPPEMRKALIAMIPMGRTGTVAEAVAAICWIASPECSYTTGFVFDLSGGRATY